MYNINNKCNFNDNNGSPLYFRNRYLSYCNVNILFIGPMRINGIIVTEEENMIYAGHVVVHITGPMNISNNTVYGNNIMVFKSCKIFVNGPITISDNLAMNMLLQFCSVLFQGLIIISDHYTDSVLTFETCDVLFNKKIMFISNQCSKIINIKSEYPCNATCKYYISL